jgi:hypothetical protein
MCETESGGLDGVLVASDRERRDFVYLIDVDTLVTLFRDVGDDYIIERRMRRDSTGEMRVIYSSRKNLEQGRKLADWKIARYYR